MKKNLEILEIEAKLTKDEKKYWRVKTAEGWMSCFDVAAKDALKELKSACCEVIEKKGTNFRGEETVFYNITKCYGESQNIDELTQDEKPEVVRPGEVYKSRKSSNGNGSMYASYAKDVFCVLRDNKIIGTDQIAQIPQMNKDLMTEAIALVKQAKEAFE